MPSLEMPGPVHWYPPMRLSKLTAQKAIPAARTTSLPIRAVVDLPSKRWSVRARLLTISRVGGGLLGYHFRAPISGMPRIVDGGTGAQ